VWIFEAKNLAAQPQLLPHNAWVENLDWSPDGNLLAVVTRANEIHLWDLNTVTDIYTFGGEHTVKFSPDGKLLAFGGQHYDGMAYFFGTVQLLELDTKAVVANFYATKAESRVTDIAFSKNGQWISAALAGNGTGYCFIDELQVLGLWPIESGIRAFSQGEIAASVADIFGHGFDVDFMDNDAYILRPAVEEINLLDVEILRLSGWDVNTVETSLIQLEDKYVRKMTNSDEWIAAITQEDENRYHLNLFASDDGQLLDSVPIWQGSELIFTMDSPLYARLHEKAPLPYYGASALELSPNGEQLATLIEGELRLWNISDSHLNEIDNFSLISPELPPEIEVIQGNEGFICQNFQTPEGSFCGYFNQNKTLFIHMKDSVYWLWDLKDGIYYSLPFPDFTRGFPVGYYLAFSPDGKSMLIVQQIERNCTMGPGYLYELWDISGEIPSLADFGFDDFPDALIRWSDSGPKTYDVIFSPDSQLLFTASNDGIAIWKPDDGEEIIRLTGHNGIVQRISISDDGTRLISKGRDGTIRLWGIPKANG
jgi:WD40 repeat protein